MEGEGLDFGDSPAPAVEMDQPSNGHSEAIPEPDIGKVSPLCCDAIRLKGIRSQMHQELKT